ncbi:hypothetical protein D3C73_903810 [compost metagenome]
MVLNASGNAEARRIVGNLTAAVGQPRELCQIMLHRNIRMRRSVMPHELNAQPGRHIDLALQPGDLGPVALPAVCDEIASYSIVRQLNPAGFGLAADLLGQPLLLMQTVANRHDLHMLPACRGCPFNDIQHIHFSGLDRLI